MGELRRRKKMEGREEDLLADAAIHVMEWTKPAKSDKPLANCDAFCHAYGRP
eukprot:COSAG05_NODE_2557_length_2908_cov_14.229975_2_plen_52_part_00